MSVYVYLIYKIVELKFRMGNLCYCKYTHTTKPPNTIAVYLVCMSVCLHVRIYVCLCLTKQLTSAQIVYLLGVEAPASRFVVREYVK